jgi:sporulation protein YlmC with PRC-barrel domain
MLFKAKELNGYKLDSLDGPIGEVQQFYFDDKYWTIRYLVANSGSWLTGRQVLIAPYALVSVLQDTRQISINLSKSQIEESPSLDSDKPVSKQFENSYWGYYGWPTYWSGAYMWGAYPTLARDRQDWLETTGVEEVWDPNLRSTGEVIGYHIQASDGEIGHVEDFIIDDETWAIRYLVVDTKNWWPGEKLLVSPRWINRVSWADRKVFVDLSREIIKNSPKYSEDALLTRDYEDKLHRHYNRPGYWADVPVARAHNR